MIGRPVSIHAMRGISAHSNGFHTCRALHFLQILLGSIDAPGGLRYKAPYPKSLASLPRPSGRPGDVKPNSPLPGPHLGFLTSPEDLLVDENGTPQRIDKAFSWDAPLAAHGLMHMVISNAYHGDPYPIELLFMYMANMAWNSAMNTSETIDMLTAKNEETGEYKIPRIIYSDAFASEMVSYADLVLPDTTYLERWDSMSLLDRPIGTSDAVCDAIRQPVVEPDRDVRPFQDVLLDLGGRLGLPGLIGTGGRRRYPGGYSDYLANHERAPGIGTLAGWRGKDGTEWGKGAPNPDQLQRYVENECFWREELAENQQFFRNVNRDYLAFAVEKGFIATPDPIIIQLYSEPLQRFRLAAQGHGEVKPPEEHRERIETYFDPLPFWYPALEDGAPENDGYTIHAITQRPMAMYHSWGSQNAWLRQIHGSNRLFIPQSLAKTMDIADDDWVWLESRTGRIKGQVRLMSGVNEHTVWTWNAIGKRSGSWNLAQDAPESQEGFLLNHLIDELLPEQPSGYRYTNSDPITGQAAWFDLKVKITKADPGEPHHASPQFDPLPRPQGLVAPDKDLRFGGQFKRSGKK
ncbi:MAG: molybdopterin oxidoreductase family protein, partial [Proteobacteria bacterium]|nr:molybdopterin oxidoreductase family protein [Pseudomonadota bacterium]